DAYGGDAYGIFIEEVAGTATVTNSGTINATGGDAYGGNGGDGYYGGDGGYGDGGDAYGINIQYAGTATVTNSGTINATGGYYYSGDGGTGDENGGEGGYGHGGNAYGIYMYEIGGEETATVNNSGTINAYGGYAYGGEGGDGYYGGDGSRGYGGDAFGVYIYNAITATMTNSGTINAYGGDAYGGDGGEAYSWGGDGDDAYGGDAFGIYIGNVDTATVTNSGTINAYGGDAYGGDGAYSYDYDSGYGDDAYGGDAYGVYIYEVGGVDTATMTNSGAINAYGGDAYGGDSVDYDYDGGDAYGGDAYGIYIYEALTATVTNNISGTINGDGGDAYAGYGDRDGDAYGGYGYGIYIADAGTATVDNYGTINAYGGTAYDGDYNYGGDGTGVYIANVETTTVNNSGTINGYRGSGDDPYSYGFGVRIQNVDTAEVSNKAGGTINGDDFGVLIQGANERTVTNENGGTISGEVGIGTGVGGSTRIFNYGKIESTDGMSGRAIVVRGYDNQVTLGTGTEIIGNIVAVNSDEDNLMFLDGQGTIYADQMRGFASLEKTGAGTWTLTGDMDYNSYYSGHSIYVEEGVLALSTSSGVGNGVVTDSFTQTDGSLGYEVTATGYTGRMTVNGDADFNNGTIIVIPLAGTYAEETRYANVLTADSTTNQWTGVVSTSAFLSPSMADAAVYGGSGESYDLILERLSFTTAATESANGLAAALDGMYDTATGDLRILLDELIVMSPDVAQTGLSQLSGGTHTAFQLMSFNGIGRYLGVLNNHMSGGSGFAFDKQSSGFAWNSGMQMAMAGGGNSMSDAMPMMLAMAGNVSGQSQIASGTNWGIWADGYFSKGNRRSDELISEYDQTLFGGMIGFDFRIANNLFMGISAGISNTELDFDNLPDEGEMNSYHGSLYLCYDGKPWYALGIMTYAYNDYDLDRYITTLGPTVIAKSDYSGKEYVGYAELGYKLNAGGVTIRPLVAFQVDYLDQESFEETGAGIYNLAVDDNGTGSYQSFLGVNISGDIKMGASASLKPELRLKWAHEFSNDDHLINAQLAGGGGSFTVEAETLSRDTAIVGAGLTLMFNKNVSAYVQYDAELNSDFINHTGLVGLRLAW
ncbi:MAG: autotransporter domain-containing protein, partial [Smithella sp.]